jgi:hypothetical protein
LKHLKSFYGFFPFSFLNWLFFYFLNAPLACQSIVSGSFSFLWLGFRIPLPGFFLGVFKASKIVIQANCQVYYLIEVVRICNYCYRALDLGLQAIEKSRYFSPVVPGNPGAVFIKFG